MNSLLATSLLLGASKIWAEPPSTWTGTISSDLERDANWDYGVPYGGIAIFNGNGDNSPLSNRDGGIEFSEMRFTSNTQVSVITNLEASGIAGILANPGVTATFDVYEHQPLFFSPATLRIDSGPAASGGGTVRYNLEAYGQLYAYSGSTDATTVNVLMSGGNNYFEIDSSGTNIFDNISSDSSTDEIYISSGSNLTIRGSDTNTIQGLIAGAGSLTKTGNGTLILSNNNTYSGDTLISSGILQLDGTLPGNLTVDSGGKLQGIGRIAGDLVVLGTISPGNSIGIFTTGNYTSASSGVFACEISSSGASDQIVATGAAILGGTLDVIPLDLAFTSAQTYNILQAAEGISGIFSSTQTSVPALMSLTYNQNSVSLTYLPLSVIGLHDNADAAANCFTSLSSSDANTVSGQLLGLSFSGIDTAFTHMQPSQFSAQTWNQLANALLIRSGYSKHLTELSLRNRCSDNAKPCLWVDGFGQWEKQHGKDSQFGYDDWTAGVSLGTDASYKKLRIGGALSYTYSNLHWNQTAGNGQINSYYGGLYGSWSDDVGYVIFSALGSYNQYHTSRHLSINHLHRHAHGSHNGWEVLTGLEGGAYFNTQNFRVGPFARVDYIYLWQQGYQEHGANSLNLHVDSRQDQLIQSQAGIAFTTLCNSNHGSGIFIPRLELSYINQTPLGKSDYRAQFKDSSCKFHVSGWNFERNLGAVGASLSYLSSAEKLGISLQYDGQFASKYWNQSGQLLFNIKY